MGTCSTKERRTAALTHHVRAVMELFGVKPDENRKRSCTGEVPPILPGQIVLITGPSGAGKSTLLAGMMRQLETESRSFVRLEDLATDQPAAIIDCFDPLPLKAALTLLSRAGLAEARLLLRRPSQLSEGERFRFRLAQFYASPAQVLVADEFAANLDRVTARIVAYNLRQFIRRNPHRSALLATSHEDLTQDLRPDTWARLTLETNDETRMTNDESMTNAGMPQ